MTTQITVVTINIFSFFSWMRHVFRKGRREELSDNELYDHLPGFDSEQLTEDLQEPWIRESQRKHPSLLHLIFTFYGCQFVPICVLYSALEIAIQ